MSRKLVWVLAMLLSASTGYCAQAPRVALVIGNARYEPATGPLRNPDNDAKAVAKTLRGLGFAVMERHDVKRDGLLTALAQFQKMTKGAQVALFYFAGHGLAVDGHDYLVPIKAEYRTNLYPESQELMAETHLFNVNEVIADMSAGGATCTIAILDACRSASLEPQVTRGPSAGGPLVEISPPTGSLVAFATDSGHVALDGTGRDGLYTEALLKNLATPGLSIEQVFKRTRGDVIEKSSGAQVPAEYSRLVGDDIYLAGKEVPSPSTVAAQTPAPSATPAETRDEELADICKLAAAGTDHAMECLDRLTALTKQNGPGDYAAVPLDTLLDKVKLDLKSETGPSQKTVVDTATCDRILASLPKCVSQQSPHYIDLEAKTNSRRGDALMLLGRAQDALTAYNAALEMHPIDAYILYNRGTANLALGQKDAARADFQAAETNAGNQPGAKKLAREGLKKLE